jgi:hypothetical protein
MKNLAFKQWANYIIWNPYPGAVWGSSVAV